MRLYILLALCFLSDFALADIPKHVSIAYDSEGKATVDFSDLAVRYEISEIDFLLCSGPPLNENVNECASEYPPSSVGITPENTFDLIGSGLYLVRFYDPQICGNDCRYTYPFWEQFVVVPDVVESNLKIAIENYSPLYSFHDDEVYFPIQIEELFSRSVSDLSVSRLAMVVPIGIFDLRNETDSITNLLANNGHVSNRVRLDANLAISLEGNKNDFPVYWIADKVDSNNYWVTYYTFYAYDIKYPEYIKTDILASAGNHELDREGISVLFSRVSSSGSWTPREVVYAGHLENQPTTFVGCSDESCAEAGAGIVRWENGRTKLLYPNYANIEGRPIVYVAHGSHAQAPAYGYYSLEVARFGFIDVLEPAGSFSSTKYSLASSVRQLDFKEPTLAAFTYSGGLIRPPRGLEPFYDWGRFPPFIRYPAESWAETAAIDFNECINTPPKACEVYMYRDTLNRIYIDIYESTADRDSKVPRISGNGRIIAFISSQRNYTNSTSSSSLYVHNRETDTTELIERVAGEPISLSKDGRYVAYKRSGGVKVYDRQENTFTVELESLFFNRQLIISQSGRYVAFDARKDSLSPGDTNNRYDVYVKDRETGEIEIVSDPGREDQTENVYLSDFSPDGRYVVYHGKNAIYIYDRTLDVETRVMPNGIIEPTNATISDDGRHVVFEVFKGSFVNMNGYTFGSRTLYTYDFVTGVTQELTVDEFGTPANSSTFSPKISGDGRFITFISAASNWVSNDTNRVEDVFVYDRNENSAQRMNVNDGVQADKSGVNRFSLYDYVLEARGLDISSDPIEVVFTSQSDILDVNDNNLHADVFVRRVASGNQ